MHGGVFLIFILILAILYLIFYDFVINSKFTELKSNNLELVNLSSSDANKLSILEYNIQMRPYIDDFVYRATGIHTERTGRIVNDLPKMLCKINADVVVLVEAFSDIIVDKIAENMTNYPFYTSILGMDSKKFTNGGIIIFSKYPIVGREEYCFKNSAFIDSWAAKGVQYVKINKLGAIYNILATHTNASYGGRSGAAARYGQFAEIADFIKTLRLSEIEPIIFTGDLNIDLHEDFAEYHSMLRTLNMTDLMKSESVNTLTSHKSGKLIDYILYSGKKPKHAVGNIIRLSCNGCDISDHNAIIARFAC